MLNSVIGITCQKSNDIRSVIYRCRWHWQLYVWFITP